ncbi:hypothetical protein ymoll0001_10110 [Yersinia mollaretii ATCC 43969]|uniref:Uncharacterized protein n=1 Tax=Yersinia mollaretii (strain ATCC 43969 / DSM 18520 / CIP 103324 / CNY 7263 / WAIP 204) TaxID=349967 RepID=A0ABP2EKE1_YERMW|nr:hypothetical protein ymoll0001_10110 [Yersinia mollaretii ATCC 43969]
MDWIFLLLLASTPENIKGMFYYRRQGCQHQNFGATRVAPKAI